MAPRRPWPLAATLALFAAAWVVLASPWLSGRVTIPWDAKAHFYPQLQFLAQSIHRGEWPFWTPFVFSGSPQIADPQSLIFSPPYLALALLDPNPSFQAFDAVAFAMLGLGGVAIVLLFRDRGWRPEGALVAAIAFAFGASAAWRIQHIGQILSLGMWPIAYLLLLRALERRSLPYGFAAGLAAGVMALDRDQVAYLGLLVLAGAVLWHWFTGDRFERPHSPSPRAAAGRAGVGGARPGRGGPDDEPASPEVLVRAGPSRAEPPPTLPSPPLGCRRAGGGKMPTRRAAVRASLGPLALGALGGALVVTIPVLLSYLLAEDSNRPEIGYGEAISGSLHPALLLTGLIPNLFGVDGPLSDYWGPPSPLWGATRLVLARNMGVIYLGALPMAALLAVGLGRGAALAREIRFVALALLALLLYALGGFTPAFRLFYLVPGVDLFRRPADATFLIGALAAILAGYGVHRLLEGTLPKAMPWRTWLAGALLAAAFAAALALALAKGTWATAAWPLAKAAICLGASLVVLALLPRLERRARYAAPALLAAVLVADLAWNNGPNESTGLPPHKFEVLRPDSRDPLLAAIKTRLAETAGPDRIDRVELAGIDFHWPNASLVHRLHHDLGYNPLRLGLYAAATGAGDAIAVPEQRAFPPLFPSYRSTLADRLGLRLIATGIPVERIDRKLAPGDLDLIARTPEGNLYENPRAAPRVRFAGRAVAADFDAMIRTGTWPEADRPDTVLLAPADLARTAAHPAEEAVAAGRVTIASYRNTEIVLDVAAAGPGYAVLNDPWQPWWFAEVDGRPAPLLRADVIFRAVPVPPGRHRVRFVFRPLAGAWREIVERWSGP